MQTREATMQGSGPQFAPGPPAIFLATCNAILLLADVKLANMFPSQFANISLTYNV